MPKSGHEAVRRPGIASFWAVRGGEAVRVSNNRNLDHALWITPTARPTQALSRRN